MVRKEVNKELMERFEVLMAASMKMAVFSVLLPNYKALQPRRQPS
jgi:hypothetical protein